MPIEQAPGVTGVRNFTVFTKVKTDKGVFVFTTDHPPVNVVADTDESARIVTVLGSPESLQTMLATGNAQIGVRDDSGSIAFR